MDIGGYDNVGKQYCNGDDIWETFPHQLFGSVFVLMVLEIDLHVLHAKVTTCQTNAWKHSRKGFQDLFFRGFSDWDLLV